MRNRIKLLFLSVITPLLCIGVSFANDPYTITIDACSCIGNMATCLSDYDRDYINSHFYAYPVCFDLSFEDYQRMFNAISLRGYYINGNYTFDNEVYYRAFGLCDTKISRLLNSFDNITFQGNVNMCQTLPMTITFYDNTSFGGECPDCSSCEQDLQTCNNDLSDYVNGYNSLKSDYNTLSGNYNSCLNTLNSCNGQVGTLSGQLASCNSDLASCTNSCDTLVAQCTENLSGCNADLSSMTNYKDSLEDQLQQCLAEIPEPCTGTGCDEVSTGINTVFSFFWERDDNMFSLPISNNIFLPRGITAYIDSGVVALAEEEKQKIKIDQGFEVLSGTYYHFFIGLVMLGIFCLFAYYVKKFISKSFIPKEK